ncbi:MAG: BON domain-containing protein [Desulfobulbaceae bacterium]|nr:BON domain-containing protein [Desulfobulbaceae bacterium]
MKERKHFVFLMILLVAFVLPLISGCATPAGRSAGEVIDDSTISTKVKAKLFDSTELSGFAISVKTFEGEVTLTGAVDTPEQKEKATEIARSVSGVRGVNNLLNIK